MSMISYLLSFHTQGDDYERVIAVMRSDPTLVSEGDKLSTLRPKNYIRNAFHVSNATLAVLGREFFLSWEASVLLTLACLAW